MTTAITVLNMLMLPLKIYMALTFCASLIGFYVIIKLMRYLI